MSIDCKATVRAGLPVWRLTLEVVPVQLGAILAGCEAYVVAVMRQERYVRRHGAPHLVVWTALLTHALCAVGIYLGRVHRCNSWDVLLHPGQVLLMTMQAMTTARPLGVIGVTCGMLTLGYWGMQHLTLGMRGRLRTTRGRRARWG